MLPRAEVALRTLDSGEQSNVASVLARLERATTEDWSQVVDAKLLRALSGEDLYSVKAGHELRLLAKILAGNMIVQDIFPRERLERISGQKF